METKALEDCRLAAPILAIWMMLALSGPQFPHFQGKGGHAGPCYIYCEGVEVVDRALRKGNSLIRKYSGD